MQGKTIDIDSDKRKGFTGYLSVPESGKGPGLLLIQEIFGVNSHIRDVADLYADAGYVVLAPDVFWRVEPGVQLGYTPDDMQKGMALAGKLDVDETIGDLSATCAKLRTIPGFGGKIGTVGYCMGGKFAYLMATRDRVDAAVSYYGGGIDQYLADAKNLHCPIMMHFGAKDAHIPISSVEKIEAALKPHGHVEVYVYKNADHGFNCDQRATYHRPSAMLAFARSDSFFNKHLT